MSRQESLLQQQCVKWFRLQYPRAQKLLFSIPNEGARSKSNASRMKAEGMTAGVSDLFLAVPYRGNHGLFIEMKTAKGRLSDSQKEFGQAAHMQGYQVEVCRSFDQFREIVTKQMLGMIY